MRRGVMVGAWAGFTALAVSLASGAVSLVANGVSDRPPEALPPAEILAALRAPGTGQRSAQPATAAKVPYPGAQAGPAVGANRTAETAPGTRVGPPVTSAAPGGPPSPVPTTTPGHGPEPTGPVEDGRSPPASPPPGNSTPGAVDPTRAFATPGGVVTVACHNSAISLVSATPNDGYAVIVDNSGPERVDVRFTSGSSVYHVQARCADGQPAAASPDE